MLSRRVVLGLDLCPSSASKQWHDSQNPFISDHYQSYPSHNHVQATIINTADKATMRIAARIAVWLLDCLQVSVVNSPTWKGNPDCVWGKQATLGWLFMLVLWGPCGGLLAKAADLVALAIFKALTALPITGNKPPSLHWSSNWAAKLCAVCINSMTHKLSCTKIGKCNESPQCSGKQTGRRLVA